MREFNCDACGGTFQTKQNIQDCNEQFKEEFPNNPRIDSGPNRDGSVCDDCFLKMTA